MIEKLKIAITITRTNKYSPKYFVEITEWKFFDNSSHRNWAWLCERQKVVVIYMFCCKEMMNYNLNFPACKKCHFVTFYNLSLDCFMFCFVSLIRSSLDIMPYKLSIASRTQQLDSFKRFLDYHQKKLIILIWFSFIIFLWKFIIDLINVL